MAREAFNITTLDTGLRCAKCKTIVVAKITPIAISPLKFYPYEPTDELSPVVGLAIIESSQNGDSDNNSDLAVSWQVDGFYCLGCGLVYEFPPMKTPEETLEFVRFEIERLVNEERQRRLLDERRKQIVENN